MPIPIVGVKRAVQKRRLKRDALWPDATARVFNPASGGWSQTPRTIALIGTLIDVLSEKERAGRLYMTLWGHEYGDGFIEVPDPAQIALEAGYFTNRAERTFNERIALLKKLGFVETAPLGLREFGFLLLVDPHVVVTNIRKTSPKAIPDHWWTAFVGRCATIGVSLQP